MVNKQLLKDALGWGVIVWLIGYVLGIILFFVLPSSRVGWAILPIGILITLWILLKKVKGDTFRYYVFLAVAWTVIAVVFDYLFIVKAFKPVDGYYKLDVYVYYTLTCVMPLTIGWWKKPKSNEEMVR
jgi:O-antigen ligase